MNYTLKQNNNNFLYEQLICSYESMNEGMRARKSRDATMNS